MPGLCPSLAHPMHSAGPSSAGRLTQYDNSIDGTADDTYDDTV